MKRFWKYYDKIEEGVLVLSLVATVSIIALQIIFRYFLNAALSWSEELTRYIFIWQIWLGTSYVIQGSNKHLRVTLLYDVCPPVGKKWFMVLSNGIFLAFCLFLAINGWQLVAQLYHRQTLSAILRLPMYLVYLALPFSSLIAALRIACQTVDVIRGNN